MVYPSWNLAGIPRWPTRSQTAFSDLSICSAISRTLTGFEGFDNETVTLPSSGRARLKIGCGSPNLWARRKMAFRIVASRLAIL